MQVHVKHVKIALVSMAKPRKGTGDGITEYSNQIYCQLRRRIKTKIIYNLNSSGRGDVFGLLRSNIFRHKMVKLLGGKYDLIHITNHEIGFVAKIAKGNNPNVKVITTIHDLMRFSNGLHRGLLQKIYNEFVKNSIRDAVQNSDALIFNSTQTQKEVYERFPNAKHIINKVISNGVDDTFIKTQKHKKDHKLFTIGYVGSLAYHKNVIWILRIAKVMRKEGDVNFIIYGTGSTRKELLRFKNKYNLNNVIFEGFAPQDKLVKIYDSFDAFIFPSCYEGFGIPILEAQTRGLPVIINKNAEIPEEVRKYCFEANSIENAVSLLIKLKKGRNKQFKQERTYSKNFTWTNTANKTINLYKELLKDIGQKHGF